MKIIKIHTLFEMASVGITQDNIEIKIFGKEGNIPHFHFQDAKNLKRKGCIKILQPEYFVHKNYTSKLNSIEKKNLIIFLDELCDADFGYKEGTTNYEVICYLWNANNPLSKIKVKEIQQPDYKQLN